MVVTIHLFASLRDAAGAAVLSLDVSGPLTSSRLLELIAIKHPTLRERLRHVRVAVDHDFVSAADPIKEGAQIALIPPVSGG